MYRGTRALIHYAGKIMSERQAKRRFGTCGRRALAKLGIRSHLVPRRARYFAFRGVSKMRCVLGFQIGYSRIRNGVARSLSE
jgi:hypothetical protein